MQPCFIWTQEGNAPIVHIHRAWQVTCVLPTLAISASVLSCQWGFLFSVVWFCVCSVVCVCVNLTSQLAHIGIGVTLGPLGIAVGQSLDPLGVAMFRDTCSHCHCDVNTHMQSWILNVVQA